MLRTLIAIVAVAALVAPAAAVDWDFPAGGTADEDIDINLTLDGWVQIDWQDQVIDFNGANDYWAKQLMNVAYAPGADDGGKTSQDPWAGADYYTIDVPDGDGRYFESFDGGVIFVRSNVELSMTVGTNGDLLAIADDCDDCSIPTWFTVALNPFWVAGDKITTGTIPYSTPDPEGCYLFDDAGEFGYDNATYNCPNQHAFSCASDTDTWTLGPLCPYVEGTIKFLARILRHGLEDASGAYTTHLDVLFSAS